MADKINFFGFTGENTVGDFREFFENTDGAVEELCEKLNSFSKLSIYDSVDGAVDRTFDILLGKKIIDNSFSKLRDAYETKRDKYKNTLEFSEDFEKALNEGIKLNDFLKDTTPKKETFGFNSYFNSYDEINNIFTSYFAGNQYTVKNSSAYARRKLLERAVLTDEFKDVLEHYIAAYYPEKPNDVKPEIALDKAKDYSLEKIFDDNLRGKKKQFVLTGAPGTGKTYSVRELTKAYINEKGGAYEFVQFHSSYDYTDFVEGLKPIRIDGSSENVFVRMDGVFKSFCRKAENEIIARIGKGSRSDAVKDAPLCFFLIDEINRADLSRVFGELMFSLEESYRGPEHRIKTQYSSLPTYDAAGNELESDVFREGFYIPENVIIIGTMNDIDRNVESFDFALRRRFSFIEIDADDSLARLEEIMGADYDADAKLEDHAKALNQVIEAEPKLGPAFKLGLTYFKDRKKDQDLGEYFDAELNGILREYVRGWKKTEQDAFIKDCKIAFTKAPESNDKNQGNG